MGQSGSDLFRSKEGARQQVWRKASVLTPRLGYSLCENSHLRLRDQRDLHRPFTNMSQQYVKPEGCGEDEDFSAQHSRDPACSIAEQQLLRTRDGNGLIGEAILQQSRGQRTVEEPR